MRARGNTAAFTIESSYRARLDWDRTPKMRRSFEEVGSREAVQRGTHAFDWSILRSATIGGSDSKCMGRMRSGILQETTHEKVERGNGGDATEYREDRRNSFPSEWDLRNRLGRSDGKCRPDARRGLPALRLEGPTPLRSFGGARPGPKRGEGNFRPLRQGPHKA